MLTTHINGGLNSLSIYEKIQPNILPILIKSEIIKFDTNDVIRLSNSKEHLNYTDDLRALVWCYVKK